MKVVVFGSTGGTGRELVKQALAAGHEVTAFARNSDPGLGQSPVRRIVTGDITNPGKVESAVKGQQAVLSALGAKGKITVCAPGMRNVLAAMNRLGVRRLIAVSAFGAAESHDRSLYSRLLWLALRERMEDKDEMERLIRASNLEWTLVRPPALTNGKKRGQYRVGTTLRMSLFSKDLARRPCPLHAQRARRTPIHSAMSRHRGLSGRFPPPTRPTRIPPLVPLIAGVRAVLPQSVLLALLHFDLHSLSVSDELRTALSEQSDAALDEVLVQIGERWTTLSSLGIVCLRGPTQTGTRRLETELSLSYAHLSIVHILCQAAIACWCESVFEMILRTVAHIPTWPEYDSQCFWGFTHMVAQKVRPEDLPCKQASEIDQPIFGAAPARSWDRHYRLHSRFLHG